MVMIMLIIKIMMINHDKKSEGTMMVISMILMTMMMMMTMMMQLAICKTDKWEKQNPSGSPPLPNGHKCKSLADCGDDDDDEEEEDDEDPPAAKCKCKSLLTRLSPIAHKLQSLVKF